MVILSILLLPFSLLYSLVMRLRNLAYDQGWLKSHPAPMPVISVGNLSAGGTGKTPMVEWLVRELQAMGHRPAVLSRGYGRKTQGYRRVNENGTAADFGDEPLQLFHSLPGVPVAVCEDRYEGALALDAEAPIGVLVLDDAFQHRSLKRNIDLVLLDASRPPHQDWVLPAGRLREPRSGLKRASLLIFTKVADAAQLKRLKARYRRWNPAFTTLRPKGLQPFEGGALRPVQALATAPVLAFAGIGNPGFFKHQLVENGAKFVHFQAFGDHEPLPLDKMEALLAPHAQILAEGRCQVVTTAKDFARLSPQVKAALLDKFGSNRFFYMETEVHWLEGQDRLSSLLNQIKKRNAGSN